MNQQEHERYVKEDPANLTDRELVEFQPQADAQSKSLENSTNDDDQFDCLFLRRRSTALSEEIAKRNGVREKQREQESVEATKKLLLTDAVTLPVVELSIEQLSKFHSGLLDWLRFKYATTPEGKERQRPVIDRCVCLRGEARRRGEYILDSHDAWQVFEQMHSDEIIELTPVEVFHRGVDAEAMTILWEAAGDDLHDFLEDDNDFAKYDKLHGALIELIGDVDTSEFGTKTLEETAEAGLRFAFDIRAKIVEKLVPIVTATTA